MSPRNVSESLEPYLAESEAAPPELFVSVPPSLPPIVRRRGHDGLNGSRFGVGVEGPRYEADPTGAVWQSWVVLGLAIALVIPGAVAVWATGDWILFAIVAPIVGLFLMGIVRTIREEQSVKRTKMARLARRRDMRD